MAGRRQHYIPQFLQRGFLSTQSDQADLTWLHLRNTPPRLVSTRDVGVGEYFYSKLAADGSSTLDDLITELECGPLADLASIKRTPIGELIDPTVAIRLVAHLTVRTAHVRECFEHASTLLFD